VPRIAATATATGPPAAATATRQAATAAGVSSVGHAFNWVAPSTAGATATGSATATATATTAESGGNVIM